MEKTEKWKPHPTRKNIFINQGDGLMYERLESGWHNMIEQELTECQELEIFRKSSGLVAMTSRSRGKFGPPTDKVVKDESK